MVVAGGVCDDGILGVFGQYDAPVPVHGNPGDFLQVDTGKVVGGGAVGVERPKPLEGVVGHHDAPVPIHVNPDYFGRVARGSDVERQGVRAVRVEHVHLPLAFVADHDAPRRADRDGGGFGIPSRRRQRGRIGRRGGAAERAGRRREQVRGRGGALAVRGREGGGRPVPRQVVRQRGWQGDGKRGGDRGGGEGSRPGPRQD